MLEWCPFCLSLFTPPPFLSFLVMWLFDGRRGEEGFGSVGSPLGTRCMLKDVNCTGVSNVGEGCKTLEEEEHVLTL